MKFKYNTRRKSIEYEKAIADWWKKNKTFEKSIEQRPESDSYVFYDGPPFITGNPHHGTLLSSIVKDCVPRYWTMKGKRIERVWGWDCHGLPAENFVEKQLNITDRRDIGTKISLENYITKARESMVANSATWESTVDRIGRWVDFNGAYKTMDKDFMESVWWAFKELYDKGKIYEGEKVLMYDTKFATPVSKNEVTMDNDAYQTVTDPSAYAMFPRLIDDANLLAWTTTPWTLPANTALAVNPNIDYVVVTLSKDYDYRFEERTQQLILAKNCLDRIMVDEKHQPIYYKIISEFKGSALVGNEYMSPFLKHNEDKDKPGFCIFDEFVDLNYGGEVYAADFVSDEDGTGIVHIAPAYGEADFELAKSDDIPVRHVIDDNGYYLPAVADALREIGVRDTDENGIEVWAANKFIAKCLKEQGKVWKIEHIQHEYPFNPRSKQRIMYRAIPSWFFDIDGSKPLMLEQNENINWFPEHLKHGRFAKNIEQAPDWNLSRDRFWATAMPVWKSESGAIKVFGSYDELEEFSGVRLDDYHRPWVDEVEFDAYVVSNPNMERRGKWIIQPISRAVDPNVNGVKSGLRGRREHFRRVEKVLDCWFESGSMPFAQLHYPFENKEKFEKNYPADFIVEYVGQVRAWFYYVHAVNTALFGKNAYKNVITTGTLAGNDGRKMSKSLGNFTDPNELMDKYSADSLRFLLLSSPVLSGEDFALQDKDVSDVARKLSMIWNMYDFFTMYAEVDGWEFDDEAHLSLKPDDVSCPLDKWIISRLHQLTEHLTNHMDTYNIPEAASDIMPFIDDASNWYVRRSRRRFWKSEDDTDKSEAYRTLHYILTKLAVLLAPFTPFLAEELYQKMTGGESVHLLDWPTNVTIDQKILDDMSRTRGIIEKGLAARMSRDDEHGQIKVRQPLSVLSYGGERLTSFYEEIVKEEVNVKATNWDKNLSQDEVELDKALTPELRQEGFARELIRFVQNARKKAGLNVDDRILLSLTGPSVKKLPKDLLDLIKAETLATDLTTANYSYDETVQIDDESITLTLERSS